MSAGLLNLIMDPGLGIIPASVSEMNDNFPGSENSSVPQNPVPVASDSMPVNGALVAVELIGSIVMLYFDER